MSPKTVWLLPVFWPCITGKVRRVIGQGNFVVAFAHQIWNSIDCAALDVFRLENGLVVEHWDNVEVLPDPATLVNSGKF